MRYDNNLRYATKMITEYKGTTPLSAWLKDYFRKNKQMGSSDRRIISDLLYSFYRLGHSSKNIPVEQKLLAALFLCNHVSHPLLKHLQPLWDLHIGEGIMAKLKRVKADADINISDKLFPYYSELSEGIDAKAYELSFLLQPKLFIRIRPGKKEVFLRKLKAAKIIFQELKDDCLSLPNGTKADLILKLDEEAVIQDYNSQQTGVLLQCHISGFMPQLSVWDCCAASGGKSIMIWDKHQNIDLTVSDKRKLILENLVTRFSKAGIKKYRSFVADLSHNKFELTTSAPQKFDLIICDAPCTGSGTWSRSPEQLYYFDSTDIEKYSLLQKQILENIIPYMAPGGMLLYITCSVFKKENEDVVKFMKEYLNLMVEEVSLLKGYDMQADSMFVALVRKPRA